MTTQRFRRFLPFVLGQRIPYRLFTSLMLLVLILMCLPALSSAQQTCQPDGDVNQNGSVTAVDALLAFQQALSLTQLDACQLSIADVFPSPHAPDGNVTASDALCIFQKALGSPSCFDILPPSNQLPMVSAGGDHTCGILETGAVACWGLDDEGQSTPPAGTFTTVSAGADHTCGILDTGAVACWGLDDEGQSTPPAGTFTTVSAGADHTCGILDTGAVACWGLDDEGQSTPPAGTFTTVSAGADHTCGILETGVVACWGLDDDGQSAPPAGIFTTVSAGADHTCGILETGVVACWGLDDDGQSAPPAGIFTTVSAGADHTCGILETGVVACWGLDDDGQSAPPAGTFTTISAGADHTCGIFETGVVACWGLDDDGQSAPPGRATTPDLVVASPLVSDSNPDAGAFFTFTLSATVRNEGDGASAAITLRYYRSADATITASDTAVGTDAVAGLAASGTSEQAISLTAPSTPGTYYYGVCVDTVTDESDTTNNCSASVQVTVPEPERPDLEVGTPTVDDTTPETGASFTLSATVRNAGDGESVATTLRYYRSTNATITALDTVEGTDPVGALAASRTSAQSISLTAPSTAGTYYYGACVDTVSRESNTVNNCSSAVRVTVSDSQVDGAVTRYAVGAAVTTLPTGTWFPDVTSGASFSLSGGNSVLNLGNGGYIEEGGFRYTCESTGGCEVRNREVRAGTIVQTSTTTMPGDTQPRFAVANGPGNQSYRVGTAISALTLPEASGGDGTLAYSLTPDVPGLSFDTATRRLTGTPASAGTYNMTYTVEDGDGDTDTLGFTITVEASGGGDADNDGVPDMDDPCPQDSDDTCETATTALAPATQSEFYQRFDEKRLVEDDPANHFTHFYYRNFQETRGGKTYSGTYTYTNTGANTGTLVFNYGFGDGDGDGDTCTFSITFDTRTTGSLGFTCNDDRTGESSWYLTYPPSISQGDEDFDLDPDEQPRGATYANGRLWIVNYVGTDRHGAEGWHVHAYHTTGEPDEASGFDLDADNGDAFGIAYANERFYVVDHGDDKVYAYHASGSRDAASDFDLDPNVAEPYGIAYANDRFYVLDVGRDTIWVHGISGQREAAADFFLRSEDVDERHVSPNAITYANGRLHIVSSNNKVYAYHTSGQRDPASDFDLVANIAITVWWGIAYANDRFYVIHHRHNTVNTVYVYDGPTQAGGGDGSATRYAVGDVVTTLPTGTWFPDVTSGASFSISGGNAVISFNNGGYIEQGGFRYTCETTGGCEVRNREVRSGTVVVTSTETVPPVESHPDLVVQSPSVSASTLNEGESFTFSATVRNQGAGESAATTLRYYRSTDSTITTGDSAQGTDPVGTLSASGTSSESVSVTAPSSAGTYYYGACVESVSGETDTANNCSSAVRVTVSDSLFTIDHFDLDNDYASGITFANNRLYVVDSGDFLGRGTNKVYAYHASGQRDAAADFDLDPDNDSAGGITFANDRFYVLNWPGNKVYAYHASGQRDAASDFDLARGRGGTHGITFANDRFYVVDWFDVKAYAYHASGQRDSASDFNLDPDIISPSGITFVNDRFYVVDTNRDKIFAYHLSGQRDSTSDIELDPDNRAAEGIAYSNDRLYVVDDRYDKVYVYDLSMRAGGTDGFGTVTIADRNYEASTAISPLTLPAASGGNGALTYVLSPNVPGLSFNATTRQLTGTPTTVGTYAMTYTVMDDDGDVDSLSFTITVEARAGTSLRYVVGDAITTLPTGAWFPDDTRGSVAFRIVGGVPAIDFGHGGYIEEGAYRYTCQSTGGCQVRDGEVVSGTIVQTPSGVAPEEIPPTSGIVGTCDVALGRSAGAGGTETVSVVLADALETDVGTLANRVVASARMDDASDFDVYKIVLSDAGTLVVLSGGALDTQAVFLRSDCTEEAHRVANDAGQVAGFEQRGLNFAVAGHLGAGTYYVVVYEWASRTGNYTLEFGFASAEVGNDTPVIEPVAHQEVAPGDTATVDVEVTDDTGDAHAIVATSDNEDVATVDLRGSGSSRSLVITAQAAGTATVTLRAADQEDAVASPVTFDVIVTSPTLPAPMLEPGSNDGELEVTVVTTFGPRETRAHDYQIRVKRPQTLWHTVGCHAITNDRDSTAAGPFSVTLRDIPAGLTYDVRYRYRNSSSCNAGSPGPWSAVGEGISGGTAANATPAFPEGASTDRSVNENVGGGINVGSPVAASDADGVRDVLTYSLGGADAGSFQIVAATGQIRTRDGITYDHEARDTYSVTVEARDVHSETDRISVDIHIVDLGSVCTSPARLRLNSGDGGLTARWTPLADQAGSAAVLGYEVERRDGAGGAWGSRQIIGGRAMSNMTYTGLVNGRQYDVRIRPFGNEDPCDWSTPVSGIPTTDTAPQDQSDFEDRVPPGTQLRDWRFPVPGRFSETRDGRQFDGSYRYMRTDAKRGTITLEYDEIGRAGCEISLLFSSLTSGSFLDECEGAGVNVDVDFDIDEPPAPSSPLAPQTMEEFDGMALGNDNILPGFYFGEFLRGGRKDYSGDVCHERSIEWGVQYVFGVTPTKALAPPAVCLQSDSVAVVPATNGMTTTTRIITRSGYSS